MNRRVATTTLAAALGLAVAGPALVARAQQQDPRAQQQQQQDPRAQTMQRMTQQNLEKCYGVAARARNDCAEGAHSCAGQATRDRDPASFVLLPKGDCGKIAGGRLTPS